MRTSAYDFARSSPVTLVAGAAFGQAPNPTPTPVAPLDAVQDETTPGLQPQGLGIGSSRLDGHSGPLAAFTRRGHGFLSADGPLARQGIRTVTFVFRGRRVVINRMSPLDRLIHSPDHRRMAAICAFLPYTCFPPLF